MNLAVTYSFPLAIAADPGFCRATARAVASAITGG